ncbi:MAG: hypothetical protein V3V08_11005 [Nannocystaceae bacterium]
MIAAKWVFTVDGDGAKPFLDLSKCGPRLAISILGTLGTTPVITIECSPTDQQADFSPLNIDKTALGTYTTLIFDTIVNPGAGLMRPAYSDAGGTPNFTVRISG